MIGATHHRVTRGSIFWGSISWGRTSWGRGAAAVLAGVLAFSGLVGPAPAASADGPRPTWSVQPGTAQGADGRPGFDYTVDPGSSIDDIVTVTNHSAFEVTFGIYPADAINDPNSGAFTLVSGAAQNTGLGSWIAFAAKPEQSRCNQVPLPAGCPALPPGVTALTLQAGEHVQLPYRIQVPADAAPGDHAAGLVASWYGQASGSNGQAFATEQRVGTRVYLRVNGQLRYQTRITGLVGNYRGGWNPLSGNVDVSYLVENTGNVRLNVDQAIVLTGPFGIQLGRTDLEQVANLNPGQRVTVQHAFAGVPPLVALFASVHVAPVSQDKAQVAATSQDLTVWAVPWTLLLAVVAIAAAGWLVAYRRRVHQRRLAATIEQVRAEALAQSSETLAQSNEDATRRDAEHDDPHNDPHEDDGRA